MTGTSVINKWTYGIIGVVILFAVLAALIPQLTTSGDSLNSSGIGLGSFFATGGVLYTIIGAAVLILVIKFFMGGRK